MRFEQPLLEGTLIRRDKRFVASVQLETGEEIAAHCANPGSMNGLSEPGSKVLVSVNDNPKRRFKHHLEIVYSGRTPVGIHNGRSSAVVCEAIIAGRIEELAGYATMRQNARHNDRRIDLVLEGNGLRTCNILVKNVTMANNRVALYPDTDADRDIEELQELTDIVREGSRAMVIFVAQRSDVDTFSPADSVDPEYGQAFRDALARGVEVLSFRAKVTRKGIELHDKLPLAAQN